MAELDGKDKDKALFPDEETSDQGLRAEEIQQGELKDHKPTHLENQGTAEQTQENIRIESPQLDEDDQQSQLSSEADQKQDFQTVPKQLHNEKSEHMYLTESGQATDSCTVHGLKESERMKSTLKSRRSASPVQQSPVKGGTYDSELIRVLRERDEMKSILDRHERHMSEILANVRVLTAERDKTKMQYLQAQEEIAELRRQVLRSKTAQGSKYSATAQSILKRLETERDEARSDLHHMTTERDSLRERLKISQETAISERAHLEQRVEDLQNALLTLEQERAEQKSRQAEMREAMMGLEAQVNTLERKLVATEGELSCLKNECSMLRISNTQTENTLSETQKRLVNRIADLQRVQTMNKHLDDRNDSLVKEVTVLKEQLNKLQNTVSEVNQHRDTLHEQLERKNDLLYSTNKELDDKENSIHNMRVQIEDLEASIQAAKEAVSRRDRDQAVMRRKQLDMEDELNAVLRLKDATLRDNTQLRDELDRVHLDNKALRFKVDEATHEIEALGEKMQNYESDISSIEDLLSSKERECRELQGCQMELRTSDSENRRLKESVESLESSLQKAVSAEESSSAELTQLKSTLEKQEEALQQAQSKQLHTHQELEKARDLCIRLDTEKEAVQQELESCRSELELLRKQLGVERKKELHRQMSSQEKLIEIQILRDKLIVAESKANTQSREMAQLRTRSTLLEADLEATQRQLSTERESTMLEMHRRGLSSSFSSPILSSTMRTPPSPVRRSFSPGTSERSPHATSIDLLQRHSPDRNVTFRDIYD